MLHGLVANRAVGVAERSETIALVFEKIKIDRSCPHAEMPRQTQHLVCVFEPVRQIPTDVHRNRGTDSGERMDHARVTELLFNSRRRRGLKKLPESSAGVCESPGGNLDTERFERRKNSIKLS